MWELLDIGIAEPVITIWDDTNEAGNVIMPPGAREALRATSDWFNLRD